MTPSMLAATPDSPVFAAPLGDVIWTLDAGGNYTFVSPSVVQLTGGDPDDLIGTSGIEGPNSFPNVTRADFEAACAGTDSHFLFETVTQTADGRTVPIEVSTVLVRDETGAVTEVQGITRDITARKAAEAALRYRADFEHLISTVSGRCMQATSEEMDLAITESLQHVGEFLVADNVAIRLCDPKSGALILTHRWIAEGHRRVYELGHAMGRDDLPWLYAQVERNRIVRANTISDLPPEAVRERQIAEQTGQAACVVIPLHKAGVFHGALFVMMRERDRTWRPDEESLLRFLGDTLLAANDRKMAEKTLTFRADFEELIAEISSRFIQIPAAEIDGAITKAMREVGLFLGTDGDLVVLAQDNGARFSLSHRWLRKGITPQLAMGHTFAQEHTSWLLERVRGGDSIFVHSVDELPERAAPLRNLMLASQVQSFVICALMQGETVEGFLIFTTRGDHARSLDSDALSLIRSFGNVLVSAIHRQRAELKLAEYQAELERMVQDAQAEVHSLSGLLPICAACKNVRDDDGYWQQIESFVSERSDAQFSHSVCPSCTEQLYPEYFKRAFGTPKCPAPDQAVATN